MNLKKETPKSTVRISEIARNLKINEILRSIKLSKGIHRKKDLERSWPTI